MTARLRAFAAFWYDFIVGDDWVIAVTVVGALAVTAVIASRSTAPVWWIMVAALVVILPVSIYRATRSRR